ncbi:hypothetical protein JZN58_004314 [Vibrio vulnificus]|uniref:hypothetical protein n=1 Tax=Vibrio vulnificus TaxID=672 RepID=UPI00102AE936|nr:hypothetical protein [Vibrio vulnificus]EHD0099316.1 hypothetical protein [Vibrio vulnificus]RZR35719.1 hypothetical protein D8T58_24680 [Vibrio vulnificus]
MNYELEKKKLKHFADIYDENERRKLESLKLNQDQGFSNKSKAKVLIPFSSNYYKLFAVCLVCKSQHSYDEMPSHMKKTHQVSKSQSFDVTCPFCQKNYTYKGLVRHIQNMHAGLVKRKKKCASHKVKRSSRPVKVVSGGAFGLGKR